MNWVMILIVHLHQEFVFHAGFVVLQIAHATATQSVDFIEEDDGRFEAAGTLKEVSCEPVTLSIYVTPSFEH